MSKKGQNREKGPKWVILTWPVQKLTFWGPPFWTLFVTDRICHPECHYFDHLPLFCRLCRRRPVPVGFWSKLLRKGWKMGTCKKCRKRVIFVSLFMFWRFLKIGHFSEMEPKESTRGVCPKWPKMAFLTFLGHFDPQTGKNRYLGISVWPDMTTFWSFLGPILRPPFWVIFPVFRS
jgi:hypothetical protein